VTWRCSHLKMEKTFALSDKAPVHAPFVLCVSSLFDRYNARMVYFRTYLRYELKQPVSISSFPFPTYSPIRAPALST
jgi:hypothetical protein